MAIAHVQSGGANADATATASRAFSSNITAGSLIVIMAFKFRGGTADAFLVTDCTKSAGTATIDAIQLDQEIEVQYETSTERLQVGIWTCLCTGTGSATFQVSTGGTGDFWGIATAEFSGSWDATRLEDTSEASTASSNTNAATGNSDSAGAALFIGVLATSNNGGAHTITPDAAFATIFEEQDEDNHGVGSTIYQIVGGATTDSADWTLSNNLGWACGLAVYKEAAGAPAAVNAVPIIDYYYRMIGAKH